MHRSGYKQGGFTLIEIITVIILLGILSIVGASKFFSNKSFESTQYHQELLSAFRYAQKIAIASQCSVRVNLSSNSYSLVYSGTCSGSGAVKHPKDQKSYSDNNVSANIVSSSASFTYDASGDITPATGGNVTVAGRTIVLEAGTGFVHD